MLAYVKFQKLIINYYSSYPFILFKHEGLPVAEDLRPRNVLLSRSQV